MLFIVHVTEEKSDLDMSFVLEVNFARDEQVDSSLY